MSKSCPLPSEPSTPFLRYTLCVYLIWKSKEHMQLSHLSPSNEDCANWAEALNKHPIGSCFPWYPHTHQCAWLGSYSLMMTLHLRAKIPDESYWLIPLSWARLRQDDAEYYNIKLRKRTTSIRSSEATERSCSSLRQRLTTPSLVQCWSTLREHPQIPVIGCRFHLLSMLAFTHTFFLFVFTVSLLIHGFAFHGSCYTELIAVQKY